MDTKFTRGPWRVEYLGPTGIRVNLDGSYRNDGYIIAELHGEDKEANAHLIAAAPDLYEACQAALNMVTTDQGPPDWDMLRRALARARGESK